MRRSALPLVALSLSLGLAITPAHASPEDEARDWLERMSESLATRNYDGLFTHSSGDQTESMRIVHSVAEGRSLERLVSLDGSGREIVRTPQEVHAYLPDRRVVLVEPRTDDGSLLKALPTPGPKLDAFYELSMRKGTRLLGREIQVIDVRPKDAYRYGYRLWLDAETAMPLRSVVSDGAGRPIEQISFTRLEMRDSIPGRDVEPAVDATGFQWVRTGRKLAMPQLPANGWRPLRIPPGFRLVASRLQVLPGSPMPAQHLISRTASRRCPYSSSRARRPVRGHRSRRAWVRRTPTRPASRDTSSPRSAKSRRRRCATSRVRWRRSATLRSRASPSCRPPDSTWARWREPSSSCVAGRPSSLAASNPLIVPSVARAGVAAGNACPPRDRSRCRCSRTVRCGQATRFSSR